MHTWTFDSCYSFVEAAKIVTKACFFGKSSVGLFANFYNINFFKDGMLYTDQLAPSELWHGLSGGAVLFERKVI
jgi:hypothetical protein